MKKTRLAFTVETEKLRRVKVYPESRRESRRRVKGPREHRVPRVPGCKGYLQTATNRQY